MILINANGDRAVIYHPVFIGYCWPEIAVSTNLYYKANLRFIVYIILSDL
ncbi:hypothetical protein [Dolichospermum circinale]|nr:hypothetical protein [Dolichospermum circinale]